jgi:hypothetical protein
MTRGDIQVFISSLHVIVAELNNVQAEIPNRVFQELNDMEKVLRRDYLNKSKTFNVRSTT